jgi:ribosomal protein L11 methylase PrmA
MNGDGVLPASFRDPSGFLFRYQGNLYRQVNQTYRDDYAQLIGSGLYQRLVDDKLLIAHTEADPARAVTSEALAIIQPELLEYISYPYEWCFSQLKAAALTTLTIQRIALEHGMVLKDASAYNIQFRGVTPLLIDTLSFARYQEGQPWIAYRQFCQHFLAPLALMSMRDVRLSRLSQIHLDGIPLDLASELLPARSWLRFALLAHIHLHARSQRRHGNDQKTHTERKGRVSRTGFKALLENLEAIIRKLHWRSQGSEWGDYYGATNYDDDAMAHKMEIVDDYLGSLSPRPHIIQDLGSNTGRFSRIAAKHCRLVLSQDVDPAAVEKNFLECVSEKRGDLLPLLVDLTNPSPGIGWAGEERASFVNRSRADAVLALALVHHLAISNNLPLSQIAQFLASITGHVIIEFVPKSDSQVQRLLATREDIFPGYDRNGFETAFSEHFVIQRSKEIRASKRVLYLLTKLA